MGKRTFFVTRVLSFGEAPHAKAQPGKMNPEAPFAEEGWLLDIETLEELLAWVADVDEEPDPEFNTRGIVILKKEEDEPYQRIVVYDYWLD